MNLEKQHNHHQSTPPQEISQLYWPKIEIETPTKLGDLYDQALAEREKLIKQIKEYNRLDIEHRLVHAEENDKETFFKVVNEWKERVKKETSWFDFLGNVELFQDDLREQPNFRGYQITFDCKEIQQENMRDTSETRGLAYRNRRQIKMSSKQAPLMTELYCVLREADFHQVTTTLFHELLHQEHFKSDKRVAGVLTESHAQLASLFGTSRSLGNVVSILAHPDGYDYSFKNSLENTLYLVALYASGKPTKEVLKEIATFSKSIPNTEKKHTQQVTIDVTQEIRNYLKTIMDDELTEPCKEHKSTVTGENGFKWDSDLYFKATSQTKETPLNGFTQEELNTLMSLIDIYRIKLKNERRKAHLILIEEVQKSIEAAALEKAIALPAYNLNGKEFEAHRFRQYMVIPNSFAYDRASERNGIVWGFGFEEDPTAFKLGTIKAFPQADAQFNFPTTEADQKKLLSLLEEEAPHTNLESKSHFVLTYLGVKEALEAQGKIEQAEMLEKIKEAMILPNEKKQIFEMVMETCQISERLKGIETHMIRNNEDEIETALYVKWARLLGSVGYIASLIDITFVEALSLSELSRLQQVAETTVERFEKENPDTPKEKIFPKNIIKLAEGEILNWD